MATPVSNAKLGLKDGEFYYSGTTKGTYVVSEGIFAWLIDNLGKIADWIFGICTMGIRMVFVGWTALIEKLLTWSVEQAGGISNNGGLVVDSGDVTAIGDSSGNLTVQAIVYNQVPLFDINFFNLKTDKTVSPTGQILRCERCKKPCEECCNITEENVPEDENAKPPCTCECSKAPCSNCEKYLKNWQAEKKDGGPLIIKIREFVAMWYTIIRLLSMIVMLIVLIGIGIKMALSTVASEKAVYKRMLASWVVGMIILFAMHYLIYFLIIINETLVDTVKETASSINKTQIQFVNSGEKVKDKSGEDVQIVNDDEIEINIYEEIRTRAYDPKLTVGLSGMIMYMTLVYFAIRYSISYLKRYLTVIVLALMAPPLGVSYALQKTFSGKASSLKTWMTEFVMTVIIQIVHALIYSIFISTALALSMESVAGMIVALIFMNFALKAEKMFRQIFKMGESDSLAGSAAEAGSAEKIQSTIKAATGLVTSAAPIAGVMMNTPMAKGIKAAGKLGIAGVAATPLAVKAIGNKIKGKKDQTDDSTDSKNNENEAENNNTPPTAPDVDTGTVAGKETESSNSRSMAQEEEDQALMAEGGDSLRDKFAKGVQTLKDPKSTPTQKAQARKDMDNYIKYQMIMNPAGGKSLEDKPVTSGQIFGAHVKKAINIQNHFQVTADGNGGMLSQGFKSIFGTTHRDPHTGRQVYDGNGYFSQFNTANLLGLSDEDKKFIKEEGLAPLKAAVFGSAALMAGLGSVVAHPGIGLVGIGYGASKYGKVYKQIKGPGKYKGTYGKARFPAQTVQNAQRQMLKNAYSELALNQSTMDRGMIAKVKAERPELYNSIMRDLENGGEYSGLNLSGNVSFKQFSRATGGNVSTAVPDKWSRMPELFDSSNSNANMGIIDRYALKRAEKETAAFEKESSNLLKIAHQIEWEDLNEKQDEKIANDGQLFLEELIDDANAPNSNTSAESKSKLTEFMANCEEYGYTVDETTKKLVKNKHTLKSDDIISNGKVSAEDIEHSIDNVLQDMYRVSGDIDVTSTEGMNKALQILSSRLHSEGKLGKNSSVEVLFKDSDAAKKLLKDKADIFNKQLEIANPEQSKRDKLKDIISGQSGFSDKEKKIFEQIILENGIQGADAKAIMNQISTQMGMQNQRTKQPKSSKESAKVKKEKINAIQEFLNTAGNIQVEVDQAEIAKRAKQELSMTKEYSDKIKKQVKKKSKEKIKSVLQFVQESGDATIAELMDSTESKIKNAKNGIDVNGKKVEFSETESEALQLLFNKMKEEVVFNEFTKNVLDQKDSTATKNAKAAMYNTHVDYLTSKRDKLVYSADNIASKYNMYGINETQVTNMINGGESVSDTIKDLIKNMGTNEIDNVIKANKELTKDVNLEGKENFSELDIGKQNTIKASLSSYLNKELTNEINSAKNAQASYERAQASYEKAQRKAALTGKIDIYKQLSQL